MKGAKIIEVIKVLFDDTLLELHLNIEHRKKRSSLHLSIGEDGETVLVRGSDGWIGPDDGKYDIYSVVKVSDTADTLVSLLESEILNFKFGVGRALDTGASVIYYIKIITDQTEFLFFNNGDKGWYSFDEIDNILAKDIYDFIWTEELPVIRL